MGVWKRLREREKFLGSRYCPENWGEEEEIGRVMERVRGRYWRDKDWGDWVAYNLDGERVFIPGGKEGIRVARLWVRGKAEEARGIEKDMYEDNKFRMDK